MAPRGLLGHAPTEASARPLYNVHFCTLHRESLRCEVLVYLEILRTFHVLKPSEDAPHGPGERYAGRPPYLRSFFRRVSLIESLADRLQVLKGEIDRGEIVIEAPLGVMDLVPVAQHEQHR